MLAQHLRNRQHQIGGSSAFAQPPRKLHPNDQRNQHRDGLPEHSGFRLNSSDSPPQYSEAVDHRRMTVGAYEGVGVGDVLGGGFLDEDYAGKVFEIDLVDDAGVGGDDG
jgi:hypothetical protein